jgi:LPXTG-site transpeptidase (sortase) family protein
MNMSSFENNTKKQDIIYFITILVAIFLVSAVVFSTFGLAPDGLKATDILDANGAQRGSVGYELNKEFANAGSSSSSGAGNNISDEYTRPDRVVINKIGVNTIVEQPNTRNVADLDRFLNNGAVHYPGSGSIESGNMFIFGHSTGFQVVQNQAFKAFNDLNKLNKGDEISIYADGEEYIYRVNSVILLDENDARVDFDKNSRKLTLSTCNSFGEKDDRWIVEADFYKKG